MKDNEQDFLSRYNFEAGEREFKTPGRMIKSVFNHLSALPFKIKRAASKVFNSRYSSLIYPLFITVVIIAVLVGGINYLGGDIEKVQRLGAVESNYDVKVSRWDNHLDDEGFLPAIVADKEGKPITGCLLPSADYLNHKVPVNCGGGVTLNAK